VEKKKQLERRGGRAAGSLVRGFSLEVAHAPEAVALQRARLVGEQEDEEEKEEDEDRWR